MMHSTSIVKRWLILSLFTLFVCPNLQAGEAVQNSGSETRDPEKSDLRTAVKDEKTSIPEQATFNEPHQAFNYLVLAISAKNESRLKEIFGADYKSVLPVQTISQGSVDQFLNAWASQHTVVPKDFKTRLLAIGESGWTFPVPLKRTEAGWRFDLIAGSEEIIGRQIGRNELSVMQVSLAYCQAQFEYFNMDPDKDGLKTFAARFISTKGKRDGLYWPVDKQQVRSPLGPLLSVEKGKNKEEGSYYGYHYRILTGQGTNALGGQRSYINEDGKMTGGFAMIAWPARYGETGVMSFIVNHEEKVYQANLGKETATRAAMIKVFDPDARWSLIEAAELEPVE